MKVAISQSNYIPWKGYFDNIAQVDCFVLYDDMQYTKRDWRNRNKIKTANGLKWLSVPVAVKGKYLQKINETQISDVNWNIKHFEVLKNNYAKAACFSEVIEFIEGLYTRAIQNTLSKVNEHFLKGICEYLEIRTPIVQSSEYTLLKDGKTERLVDLSKQLNATSYFTGVGAKGYMDETLFSEEGIDVEYYDYSGYPAYDQIFDGFEHGVSILDLIFNVGDKAKHYLKTANT